MQLRKVKNRVKLLKEALALMLNIQTGYYYEGGKRFGNLSKLLYGDVTKTNVQTFTVNDAVQSKMDEFYKNNYVELFNEIFIDPDMDECLVPEELSLTTWDDAIEDMADLDTWNDYFEGVLTQESYNWVDCPY